MKYERASLSDEERMIMTQHLTDWERLYNILDMILTTISTAKELSIEERMIMTQYLTEWERLYNILDMILTIISTAKDERVQYWGTNDYDTASDWLKNTLCFDS